MSLAETPSICRGNTLASEVGKQAAGSYLQLPAAELTPTTL